MRGHKFVCLIDPTYFLEGEVPTPELEKQIYWCDDAFMDVLTFPHEKFTDNLVSIKMSDDEEYEFARDIDGRLYYVSDWYSKLDLINKFEQTD